MDKIFQPAAHRRVRDSQLILYTIELALTTDKGLYKIKLLLVQLSKSPKGKSPLYCRGTTGTIQSGNNQLILTNGALADDRMHFFTLRLENIKLTLNFLIDFGHILSQKMTNVNRKLRFFAKKINILYNELDILGRAVKSCS